MTLRAAIVDDEPPARRRLRRLLGDRSELEVVGEADSGPSAVDMLENERPDLVFLDIDLPGFDGFEVLRRLPESPVVIFTTGYDQYALQAFEASSIDYLLKPIEPKALSRALTKLELIARTGNKDQVDERLRQLLTKWVSPDSPSEHLEKLTVKLGERAVLVDVKEVTHFYAETKYVYLHTVSGQNRLVNFTLAELEQRLDPKRFVRIHRSTIVNVEHVSEIQTWFGGKYRLVLRDKEASQVVMSKSMARNLRSIIPF